MPMTIIDWIWWSVGSVIGLGGIALTIWALLADRSRGRRRCPKCWYEMTGVEGRRCPECGRTVKRERRLLQTRRRWRFALLGMLLIIAGGGGFLGWQVHRNGWTEATPTIVYIAALPWLDPDTAFDELSDRVNDGELTKWEYRFLVHRCISRLENETDPERLMDLCRMLAGIEAAAWYHSEHRLGGSWVLVSEIDGDHAIRALVALVENDDKDVRLAAISAFKSFMRQASTAMPVLLGKLASEDEETRERSESAIALLFYSSEDTLRYPGFLRAQASMVLDIKQSDPEAERRLRAFYQAAGSCGINTECAVRLFRSELQNPNIRIQLISILGLAMLGDRNAEDLSLILALADDDNVFVRHTVIGATSVFPYDKQVHDVLQRGLKDSTNVRKAALRAIDVRGEMAQSLVGDVEQADHTK